MHKFSAYSTQFDGEHFTGKNERGLKLILQDTDPKFVATKHAHLLSIHFASKKDLRSYTSIRSLRGRARISLKSASEITVELSRNSQAIIFINQATLICTCDTQGVITVVRNRKVTADRFRNKLQAHQLLFLLQKGRRQRYLSRGSKDWGRFLCCRLTQEYDSLTTGVKLLCAKTCSDYRKEIDLLNLNNGDYPQYLLIWKLNQDNSIY